MARFLSRGYRKTSDDAAWFDAYRIDRYLVARKFASRRLSKFEPETLELQHKFASERISISLMCLSQI